MSFLRWLFGRNREAAGWGHPTPSAPCAVQDTLAPSHAPGLTPSPWMEKPASEILAELGDIMERFGPLTILDLSMLPAPKPVLKALLREVWKAYSPMREAAAAGYMALAQFQDGIGPDPVVFPALQDIPPGTDVDTMRKEVAELVSGKTGMALTRWRTASRPMLAETERLTREWQEWRDFVRSRGR